MSLIDDIQKNLAEKIDQVDSLKYKQNYDYLKTPSANISFPELNGIDLFNIVQKPEKNSSPKTKKELDYVAKLANSRTIKQIELVYSVDKNPMFLYEPIIEKFNLDFPYHKFNTIYENIVSPLVDHLKNYYNRARPFQLAELYNIKIDRIITKTHHTPSYPSGHTMYAGLISEILSSIYPEKKTIFEDLVKKTALSRVLQGVHYPSDNEASIKIIKTIYPKLSKYYEKIWNFS